MCSKFDGIPHKDGKTCCESKCGKFCGAGNCAQGPGGSSACCGSVIPDGDVCAANLPAPCTMAQHQGAKLCEHVGLEGKCCELGPGEFNVASKHCSLGNDKLSSVKVTAGCTVVLQQHFDKGADSNVGKVYTLKGPGVFSATDGHFKNDDISSFDIICGGQSQLPTPTPTPSPTPAPTPSPTPAPTSFFEGKCYIGCYRDNKNRDMQKRIQGKFTVDTCRAACSAQKFKYFAVQWGDECFCGNTYATDKAYERLEDAACTKKGYPAGHGGFWAQSIYKTECNDMCSKFDGIPHKDGKTCCEAKCGKFCEAGDCAQGPGGSSACCGSVIPDGDVCAANLPAPCTMAQHQGAKLCEHVGLEGKCCELGPGEFNVASKHCSLGNDRLSSVKVTAGCTVVLQQHFDKGADSNVGNVYTLKGPGIFSATDGHFKNDDISSFDIICGGQSQLPEGEVFDRRLLGDEF